MDYEKLGYTVIKMKYGDVGKYNIKNNIFITDITPSLSAFQDVNVKYLAFDSSTHALVLPGSEDAFKG